MPPNRLRQDLIKQRKGLTSSVSSTVKSTPSANQLATTALNTVSKELLPSQRSSLSLVPNLGVLDSTAAATVPQIGPGSSSKKDTTVTFNVGKSGSLIGGDTQKGVTNLVRHEAAHLVGAGHPAIFAAGSATSGPSPVGKGSSAQLTNAAQTQGAVKLQGNTSLRAHRIFSRRVRQGNNDIPRMSGVGLKPRGFISPSPIRTGLQSDNPKRKKDARALSNKMQFRLRAAGRDF